MAPAIGVGEVSLDRFLAPRRAYGPAFSPDGRRIFFIADLTGVPQAYAVGPGGGWPEQLTFTNDRIGLIRPSPRGDLLAIAGDRDGDEREQIALLAPHGESLDPITHDLSAMHPFGAWSPDGTRLAFASNARSARDFDIVVHDVERRVARILLEGEGAFRVEAWSPDGTRLIVSRAQGEMDNDLFEVALADPRPRPLTPHAGAARHLHPAYRADGQRILLVSDRLTDALALVEITLGEAEPRLVLDLGWDIETMALSPDRERLAFSVNVGGFSELYVRDLSRGRNRQIPLPPGVIARGFVGNLGDGIDWSPDGRWLTFSFTGPRMTQNVWLVDLTIDRAAPLTAAHQGGLPSERLADARVVSYPTFDGREIPAFLYAAADARPGDRRRAVVLIHGGPESQIRPGFDGVTQFFAHQGWVVLTPNVRGSTGYGKAYTHLDDVERRMDAVADAKHAALWLASSGWADPGGIVAMGQSYGGFMVLACLATDPDVWAAGADLYGIADFVTFLENTHPHRRHLREAEYGSLSRDRAVLERISPLRHVDLMRAPLIAVHGEKDPRVPIGETEQIVAALRSRGVRCEFVRLADEGHGIVRLENRRRVYAAIRDFLDAVVPGPTAAAIG